MRDKIEVVNGSLGTKLRAARRKKNMTMQSVADAAGLSVGFISQIERNIAQPSLSSLGSVAAALGVQVTEFLDQNTSPSAAPPSTRYDSREAFRASGPNLSYERLSSWFPGSQIRAVLIHEQPGLRREPQSHDGEELIFVLQGELTFELEGEQILLSEGDSIHFDSRRTHSSWNHTDDVVTIMWCGTMDVFNEGRPDPIHSGQEALGQLS